MKHVEEGLFTVDGLVCDLAVGDSVNVRCIWGDEHGCLASLYRDHGVAMARVDLDSGGSVDVTAGRVCRDAAA